MTAYQKFLEIKEKDIISGTLEFEVSAGFELVM